METREYVASPAEEAELSAIFARELEEIGEGWVRPEWKRPELAAPHGGGL